MTNPDMLIVTEGVEGTWHYHLSRDRDGKETSALCGARVMHTSVPIEAWGRVGHLHERWCNTSKENANAQA